MEFFFRHSKHKLTTGGRSRLSTLESFRSALFPPVLTSVPRESPKFRRFVSPPVGHYSSIRVVLFVLLLSFFFVPRPQIFSVSPPSVSFSFSSANRCQVPLRTFVSSNMVFLSLPVSLLPLCSSRFFRCFPTRLGLGSPVSSCLV